MSVRAPAALAAVLALAAATDAPLVAAGAVRGFAGPVVTLAVPARLRPLTGDAQSEAHAINARGEVAGFSFDPSPHTAVIWDPEGNPIALPRPAGADASEALGIDDAGVVVGWSREENGAQRAVIWHLDRAPSVLARLAGQEDSRASGVNDAGVAVGRTWTPEGDRPAMWNAEGRPTELSRLDGDPEGEARDVNAWNVAVGWSEGPRDPETGLTIKTARRWDPSGGDSVLPARPGDAESLALAINDAGVVVGESVRPGGPCLGDTFTAVAWGATGRPRPLAPLPGGACSSARGIGAAGVIVGMTESRGVIWDLNGSASELPPLSGDDRSWANGVNDEGTAVGVSRGDAGNTAVAWR